MKNKKLSVLVYIFYLLQLSLSAAYLRDVSVELLQPDNTKVECLASGDEFHHWLHDAEGYTIVQSPSTGYYTYARLQGAELVASDFIVGRDYPQSGGLTPHLNISREQYLSKRSVVEARNPSRESPTTGTFNNLVIYLRFSNQTEFDLLTSSQEAFYNASGPEVLSFHSYFDEESYGQLNVITHLLPTQIEQTIVSYQDPHPRSYYSPYNAISNPDGYTDANVLNRVATLRSSAADYVSSMLPPGVDFDMDNDGVLDNLVFYFRGSPDGWGEVLWPKKGDMQWQNVSLGGAVIGTYNFAFQTMAGLNVQCHEFTHTLGAPDLYHYEVDGSNPVGSWDIMAGGRAHCSSYLKWHYIGWITDVPVITTPGTYTLNPLTSATGNVYRINSPNPDEFFLLEYRRKTGRYESGLPGSGLLIYRVNSLCSSNAGGPPDVLYVNRPGYSRLSDGRVEDAHFSQEVGRTVFNDSTNPYCFLSNGDSGEINIQNVGSAGETISFYYGPRSIDFEINPELQTFDGMYFTPEGWANQAITGGDVFTRIEDGLSPVCEPLSGKNMLQYNSNNLPAGNSAMLVSPQISIQSHTTAKYGVSFWMYRDTNNSSATDRIEVYRNTAANLAGTPALIGTVNRSTALSPSVTQAGWDQYSFLFNQPSNGEYYIILKAISGFGGNIYLDDVAFTRHCYPSVANHTPANNSSGVSINPVLNWLTYFGTAEGYRLSIGTDNPPSSLLEDFLLENVDSHTLSQTLCANTKYYWQIAPFTQMGDGFSPQIMSFTTAALSAINPPYIEDFDDCPIPALPSGWKIVNANNDAEDCKTRVSSSGPGQQMVINSRYFGPDLDDWAISRGLNLTGGQNYNVSFKYRRYGSWGNGKLALYYGSNSSHLEAHTLLYQNETITSTFFQTCELSLTPSVSGVYYFKFYGYSAIIPGSFNFPGLSIDDFSVTGVISAALTNPAPATGTGGVAIDTSLSWELESGSPTGYYLSLGTDSPPTNLAYRLDLGSALSWTPPAPLAYNKSYYWTVIPYSVSGEVQDCPVWQFYTQSDQVASQLPFVENFDAATVPAIPEGWTIINPHHGSYYWKTSDLSSYSPPNCVRIHRQYTQYDDIWLISPALKLYASTNYEFRFKWHSESSTSFPEKLQIAIGNGPEAAYMSTEIYNNNNMRSLSYQQVVVNFTAASTGDFYLGFQSYSDASPWDYYLYLDDIELICLDEPSPAYNPVPANLSSGIYVNDNTFHWEFNGDLEGFRINLGTDNPPSNILTNVDLGLSTSYLHPSRWEFDTQYYWQIVPYNSVGDCLEPTVFSFTTMPSATITDYPYLEDIQAVTAPLLPSGYFPEDANEDGITWHSNDAAGAKTLRVTAGDTVAGNDWLFLPELETEAGAYYQLEFLYRQLTLRKTGSLSVYYGSSPEVSAMTNLLLEYASIQRSPVALLAQAGFLAPGGTSLYIGFYFWSAAGQGTISVDEIKLMEFPAQVQALTPADNAVGIHRNPLFSWNEVAGNPQGYKLYLGTDSPPTNLVNGQDLGLVNEMYLQELLYVDTDYYWQVLPYNSQGSTPDCPIFSFHTMLETTLLTMPYNQNFDALETPALPYDWQINDANQDGITWVSGSAFPRSEPNNVRINSSSQVMDDWMFLPPMYLEKGIEYRLSFYARQGSPTKTDKLKVYYGSAASPAHMDNQLASYSFINTSYVLKQESFTPNESAAYYLGFKGYSNANQGLILIDDISVQRMSPQLYPPRTLAAQASGLSVNLNWQAPIGSGQVSYKLYRDGLMMATIPPEQTSWTDLQVNYEQNYLYYLTAVYSSPEGQSEPSNYAYATLIAAGIPLAPEAVSVQHSGSAVLINWQAVTLDDLGNPITVAHYQVHASDNPYFTPSPATLIATTALNTFQESVFYSKRFYRIIAIRAERRN